MKNFFALTMFKLTIFKILMLTSFLAKADFPATHGMLLFGNEDAYASHLPMFHSPHDYQLLMKLKLENLSSAPTLAIYQKAKASGKTLFTLVPEKMDLVQVIEGKKLTFKAVIYEGHFEREGKALGPVNVVVDKILYSQKLKGTQGSSSDDKEVYLVFGDKNEYFAFHQIASKPSFDTILQIKQPYKVHYSFCGRGFCPEPKIEYIPAEKLSQVKVFTSGVQNDPDELKEGMTVGEVDEVMFDIVKVLYVEKSELE